MVLLFDPPHPARAICDTTYADAIAAQLADRLRDVKRTAFSDALWIGGGNAESLLRTAKDIGTLHVRNFPSDGVSDFFPFDPASLDLIVVNGTLGRINDLPGLLIQMRRALKPDGLFLCAFAGGESLRELRECLLRVETDLRGGAAPRVHPMVDLQSFSALLQRAGFALPVADAAARTIHYRALPTLLRDLKNSGEGLALHERSRTIPPRALWPAAAADYAAHYAEADGLLPATIETLFGIGWGPAESQPKPLKPGSATHRLQDVL